MKNDTKIADRDVADLSKHSEVGRSGASSKIYKTGRPIDNKSFEIQERRDGGNLGSKSRTDQRRCIPRPMKGVEWKAQEKRAEMHKITDEDIR